MRASPDPWVIFPRPNRLASVRLFCLPYAGGSASIFRAWPAYLNSEIELGAIQLPGRERRLGEPPVSHLSLLVEALAASLRGYAEMPFALYGHSMGALLGFELARRLRRAGGQRPVHLFLSGHRAPQLPNPNPLIYNLPEAEFIEGLRRLEGTPEEVLQNNELLQIMLPSLRADFTLVNTYSYTDEAPLDCPISVFGSLQDSEVSRDDFQAWQMETTREFKLRMMPGGHFFLHAAYPAILQMIEADLAPVLRAS